MAYILESNPLFITSHSSAVHDDPATFIFRGNELLLGESDGRLANQEICTALAISESLIQALGFFAGRYCRTVSVSAGMEAPAGFQFVKLRPLLAAGPDNILSIAGRAFQIAEWARTHRFCGVCASEMQLVAGERCFKCPVCGALAYPRISPAMMVLITRGEQALLARHVSSTTNIFSALAGFVEAGESIEETVHREVMEEVGLKVHRLAYFGSQPWPFPHSLMVAFTAEYLSGEIRLDEREIAEARWFSRDEPLTDVPGVFSIAGHLIRSYFTNVQTA
jgi:NAD+ diphosphatase